jgi:hypothetical protein
MMMLVALRGFALHVKLTVNFVLVQLIANNVLSEKSRNLMEQVINDKQVEILDIIFLMEYVLCAVQIEILVMITKYALLALQDIPLTTLIAF